MKKALHQIHDKFFKNSLKEKKIAVDFLKTYLSPNIFAKIDITSLQHRVSLSDSHLRQGNKKLPIILPLCLYHSTASPYPYSNDLYDCFDEPEFARQVAFKPFKLIDLTILPDEEIAERGLAALLEMLFKHHRAKNFLSVMRELLKSKLVQNVIRQLDIAYLTDMLNYILNTNQGETEPQAAQPSDSRINSSFSKGKRGHHDICTAIKARMLARFSVGFPAG